jgi:hypothetical protein
MTPSSQRLPQIRKTLAFVRSGAAHDVDWDAEGTYVEDVEWLVQRIEELEAGV